MPVHFHLRDETEYFADCSFHHAKAKPNLSRAIYFSQAVPELPFGEMIFQDPTFLPGTVTMRLVRASRSNCCREL